MGKPAEPGIETELHTFVTVLHATSNRDLLEQIRRENLTLGQLQFLERLRGGRVSPTVRQAAQIMFVTVPHASRLVDELAKRGYVRRETDNDDSRRKRILITDEGQQVIVRLHAARMPGITEFANGLTDQQRARLLELLAPILHPQPQIERTDAAAA